MIRLDIISNLDLKNVETCRRSLIDIVEDMSKQHRSETNNLKKDINIILDETENLLVDVLNKSSKKKLLKENIFYPKHIKDLINAKSYFDVFYRRLEPLKRVRHIDKIVNAKLILTRFIKLVAIMMNKQVNYVSGGGKKRPVNRLTGRSHTFKKDGKKTTRKRTRK